MTPTCDILTGDCTEVLRTLPAQSVHCCVTSPPYWGLRDYGVDGQIGLEKTPNEYVSRIVEVFSAVWHALRDDGTLWLNLGDSYNAYNGGAGPSSSLSRGAQTSERPKLESGYGLSFKGLKPKDLVGVPWRVAFALQAHGWYLRSDIIWNKPNPMPESVTDRPTKSHEYIFLLSKQERYWYDAEAIKEPVTGGSHRRAALGYQHAFASQFRGSPTDHRFPDGKIIPPKANGKNSRMVVERAAGRENSRPNPSRSNVPGVTPKSAASGSGIKANSSFHAACVDLVSDRNKRSVWTVATAPYKEAHFATFPPDLIKPCILAGCPISGTVLDPFGGSGTVGQVALELGRNAILIEINPKYVILANQRVSVTPGLPL